MEASLLSSAGEFGRFKVLTSNAYIVQEERPAVIVVLVTGRSRMCCPSRDLFLPLLTSFSGSIPGKLPRA